MEAIVTKKCTRCGETKSAAEFYSHKETIDHLGSWCRMCTIENNKIFRAAHPGRKNELARRHYAKSPEARERQQKAGRTWYENHKDRVRDRDLRRHFGISLLEYSGMLTKQGGRCAICGTDTPGGTGGFHVDHDHQTGAIRGLLCKNCNTAIGLMNDEPERLARAARYLAERN